jgi:hypothetical protein
MSDLISREALIDSLYSCKELKGRKTTEAVAKTIMEQPTVEVPQWIPCSERLPNESETWYLNIEEGIHEPNNFIVQVRGAELPTVAMFNGETFIHGYADDGYGFCDEIIAWMPLPESYKGEQT